MSGRRAPRTLSREEAKAILDQPNTRCATGARDRAIMLLMYRAGLRVGEIVAARKSWVLNGGRKLIVRGRGDKEREVALDADTRAALDLWLQHRERITGNGGPLFCGIKTTGKALTTRAVQKAVKHYALRTLGEERGSQITPHQFRHTHATELLREGEVNLREVQERLGHKRLESTEVYCHVDNEALAAKIEARPSLDEAPEEPDPAMQLAQVLVGLSPEQKRKLGEALLRWADKS